MRIAALGFIAHHAEADVAATVIRHELIALAKESTQRELAADLSISPQHLGDLLKGRRGLTLALAERIGKL